MTLRPEGWAEVQRRLDDIRWHFADQDDRARAALKERIAAAGRRRTTISYSDLVAGVEFRLPSVHGGHPFTIARDDWTEQHRNLLGDFLGLITVESHRAGGFLASAVVVGSTTQEPSEGFVRLMRQIGKLQHTSRDRFVLFWAGELARAHDWYVEHPDERF